MPDAQPLPIDNLHSYVQCFDNALSADFCTQMIASFENMREAQTPNGRGFRAGLENSSWLELNLTPIADKAFLGFFFAEIDK